MEGEPCEICGQEVIQLQLDSSGDLIGPWYETRRHSRHGVEHRWWQLHNCVTRQPDDCQFCKATPDPREQR